MSVLWTAGAKTFSTEKYTHTNIKPGQSQTTFTVQKTDYTTGETTASWLPSDIESRYVCMVFENHYFPGYRYYYYSQTPVRTASVTRGSGVGEYIATYSSIPSGSYRFLVGGPDNFPPFS